MLYDELIGDVALRGTMEMVARRIEQGRPIRVRSMRGDPDTARREDIRKPMMMTGQYVPDEEHVHICLNCTKKKCKGSCSLVSRTTTGKKRQKKEAAL